jgi:hypothetical protein
VDQFHQIFVYMLPYVIWEVVTSSTSGILLVYRKLQPMQQSSRRARYKVLVSCAALAPHFPCTPEECADAALGFKGISRKGAIKNCVGLMVFNCDSDADATPLISGVSMRELSSGGISFTFFTMGAIVKWLCNHCQRSTTTLHQQAAEV